MFRRSRSLQELDSDLYDELEPGDGETPAEKEPSSVLQGDSQGDVARPVEEDAGAESIELDDCEFKLCGPFASPSHMWFTPRPFDTSSVQLPAYLQEDLADASARNIHELWSKGKIDAGWTYGETRDDFALKHPMLVPYEELADDEKAYDIDLSTETLKVRSVSAKTLEDRSTESPIVVAIHQAGKLFAWHCLPPTPLPLGSSSRRVGPQHLGVQNRA